MCAVQDKGKPVSLIRQNEWVAGWYGNNFIHQCHTRKLNGDRLLFGQTGQSYCWVLHYTHARNGAVRPDSNPLPILIRESETCLKKYSAATFKRTTTVAKRPNHLAQRLAGSSQKTRLDKHINSYLRENIMHLHCKYFLLEVFRQSSCTVKSDPTSQ
jgi:hypothetical protein